MVKGLFKKGKEFFQDLNNSKTTTNTRLKNHINTSATPHNVGTSSVPTISGQYYEVPNFPTRGRKISRNPSLYYDTYDSGDEEDFVKA